LAKNWRLIERAQELRRNPTETEKRLWRHLSNRQLSRFKFRRQEALEPFIMDFFCPSNGLIIEIDGETHVAGDDEKRDERLASRGFATIRFTNDDVMTNMDGVLTVILQALESRPDRWRGLTRRPHPNPCRRRLVPRTSLRAAAS
jgi:very-short-patch-repair endonuclease